MARATAASETPTSDLKRIRDPLEKFYLPFVFLPTLIIVLILTIVAIRDLKIFLQIAGILLALALFLWISWKLLFASILGNSIKISSNQYPQIFRLVNEASEVLGIESPTILIMQGHGLFEVFVAKRFSRRGFIILTSNLVDDLTERASSRELMFYIGRQLGLVACGYFRFWLFKHFLGQFAFLFHPAWERRCHLTADRLGLLVAGDLYAAEQALITITAGSSVAPNTNMMAIREQRTELFEDVWAWLHLAFSNYPYMVGAVALLTPDDLAAAARDGKISPRARQNVIVEIGWIWGRLGPSAPLVPLVRRSPVPSSGGSFFGFAGAPANRKSPCLTFRPLLPLCAHGTHGFSLQTPRGPKSGFLKGVKLCQMISRARETR